MIIEETSIPNVVPENISESKQVLADNIIQNVYPLFDEVYSTRVDEIDEIKKEIESKKSEVKTNKEFLEKLMNEYKRKKKISKLLSRVDKLITSGLVYDGAMKHETIVLLKIIPKLSEEKLDYHLRSTLTTISKRFSR
jgi:hypothetical protein